MDSYWDSHHLGNNETKIKIAGQEHNINSGASEWQMEGVLWGMEISYEGNNTIFTGRLKDEAHMHKVLNIIRDYNLTLISVNPEERFHIES